MAKKKSKKSAPKSTPKKTARKTDPKPAKAKSAAAKKPPSAPTKPAKPSKPAKGTEPKKSTARPRPTAATRTPQAEEPSSSRPARKPHVHAAGDAGVGPTAEPPRGRTRKELSGPTYGGVSDDAVRKATGHGWEEWLALLDGEGAMALDHKTIALMLHDKHGVEEWWCQAVTVGYEQARGKREKYQTPDGFQAGVSKTIQAPVGKLYKAWEDEGQRERWLGDHQVEVRTATADKSMRMTWLSKGTEEGSSVEVYFWPKDANKCLVQVQQRKLADAAAVQRVRAYWSVKLENLRAMMEKG
jgi:hypothetical protein